MKVTDFEELGIYKQSRELAKLVYEITRKGEVRSQLNRAFDVHFIDKPTYQKMYNDVRKLSVGILHMIQSLKDSDFLGSRYSSNHL